MAKRKNKFRRERMKARFVAEKTYASNIGKFFYDIHRSSLSRITDFDIKKCFQQLKSYKICACQWGNQKMNISVIQEDGTENEFELDICCEQCSEINYGWKRNQYEKLANLNGMPITVPNTVNTVEQFKNYVKSFL